MQITCRKRLQLLAAAAVAVIIGELFNNAAYSQTTRPIKMVVPFPAGGTADTLARILAEHISRTHQGVTIFIENRPGAGSAIGTDAVSRAAPDGTTLLLTAPAFLTAAQLHHVNYDPLLSFEPICQLTSTPTVVAVNSASPHQTLASLLHMASVNPGGVTMASLPGSSSQIAFEKLKRAAGVDITFVPYLGDAPAVNALLGEHVTSIIGPYSGMAEQLKAGGLRALAVAAKTRHEALPDVPTVAEAGYKDDEIDFWNGLFTPAKTSLATVAQISGWFSAAAQAPEVKPKLGAQGYFPAVTCGADFAALLRKQYEDFGRVIREANIKAE